MKDTHSHTYMHFLKESVRAHIW